MKFYSLWSLLDMLKVYAHQYVELGRVINEHGNRMYLATPEQDDETGEPDMGKPLSPTEAKALNLHFQTLSAICAEMGLKIAKRGIDRALTNPPKTDREYDQLISVVMDELEGQLFLYVPPERAKHYQATPALPKFPTATVELTHAENCFALAEFTACVFHSMRAVEVALDAVRKNLGMLPRDVNERSWGNVCNDIRDGIKGKGKSWAKQDQYNAIHATLVAVKDSWRNQTMHVAASYAEPEALSILENASAFIGRLSEAMDEAGQPPA